MVWYFLQQKYYSGYPNARGMSYKHHYYQHCYCMLMHSFVTSDVSAQRDDYNYLCAETKVSNDKNKRMKILGI